MIEVTPGIYRHYKGQFYSVLGIVRHSETEELMVLYIPLYVVSCTSDQRLNVPTQMTVRPLSMFTDEVNINGQKCRFERVM